MALGSVEIALLVLVFAPVFAGPALLDLIERVELRRDEFTVAHRWCVAIIAAPVLGALFYQLHGRHAIAALTHAAPVERTAGDRVPLGATATGPVPVVV